MFQGTLENLRYRAIRAGLLFMVPSCVIAAVLIRNRRPDAQLEVALFLLAAIICAGLLYLAREAYARTDRRRMVHCGLVTVAVSVLLTAERIFVELYVMPGARSADVFLPVYAFLPLLFVFIFATLPASYAVRCAWLAWLLVAGVTLPAVMLRFTAHPPLSAALLCWLFGGLPLMLRWLQLLPRFEDALAASQSESQALRKRAELNDRLSESERRFNLVVESLQVGAWDRQLDGDGRRWWSPRFYELIGYTPEELPAADESLNRIIHPEDRQRVITESAEQLKAGDVTDIDFRIMTRDRGYRWFNSAAKAERGDDGRIVRLAGAIADIHDRRVAQEELMAAKVQLTRLAYRDSLTELHNRRYFNEQFKIEIDRAIRYRRPLSLLVADLDYFKAYNDRYGHAEGDQCLISFAHRVNECLTRSSDFVARLGGEEFAVLLPETEAGAAREVAQRLVEGVAGAAMRHEGSPLGHVTVSIGISSYAGDGEAVTPQLLFTQADAAMYRAKQAGRNGFTHHLDAEPDQPAG